MPLSIEWAVDKFRHYLVGAHFTLEMDHMKLKQYTCVAFTYVRYSTYVCMKLKQSTYVCSMCIHTCVCPTNV